MRLPFKESNPHDFAADLEFYSDEVGNVEISGVEPLVSMVKEFLKQSEILCNEIVQIPGTNSLYSIVALIPTTNIGIQKSVALVREAFEKNSVDWIEPYAEGGSLFRIITPEVSIIKTS